MQLIFGRSLVAVCAAIGLLGIVGAHKAAAEYPEKPLTIVEPWPAGSAGDVPARILAELAKKEFGRPIVVQNLVGGGGQKAALFTKNAKPDGYTILNGWVANVVMGPIFNPGVGYVRADFEPIILYQINPFTLVVKADHPAKDLKEFVTWAKSQPRNVNVGVCAATGLPRLIMERFLEVAEITNYNSVPFQGCETANVKGLFDGSLDFTTGAISVVNIYGDRIRTLAFFMDDRSPILPHIPTAKEQGFDLEWGATAAGWSGLVAPKGTPPDRLRKLVSAFTAAAESDEFQRRMNETGNTIKFMPPAEFRQLWDDSNSRLKPAIKRVLAGQKK